MTGLKTLVSLHQAVEPSDVEALTSDEVTIIGAVLDLRSKPVSQIMTPIRDVFILSVDDILNEALVDKVKYSTMVIGCLLIVKYRF